MILGALLGAGASLAGALVNASNQDTANQINWASVLETKRANRKSEALQRSTRTDAYGNAISYQPGVGWQYDITPTTQKILNAEQFQKTKNLTEDANRNRDAARRLDKRSKAGDEAFNTAFNNFKYRPKSSEAADIADATQALLRARQRGLTEAANTMARQLMRTGGTGHIASVYNQAGNQYAQSLEDAMLRGKQIGKQTYAQDEGNAISRASQELGLLSSIANNAPNTPVSNSTFNADLTNRGDAALQQLIATLAGSRDSNASAMNNAAQGWRNTKLDLSGVAAALSKISMPKGSSNSSGNDMYPLAEDPNRGGIEPNGMGVI